MIKIKKGKRMKKYFLFFILLLSNSLNSMENSEQIPISEITYTQHDTITSGSDKKFYIFLSSMTTLAGFGIICAATKQVCALNYSLIATGVISTIYGGIEVAEGLKQCRLRDGLGRITDYKMKISRGLFYASFGSILVILNSVFYNPDCN